MNEKTNSESDVPVGDSEILEVLDQYMVSKEEGRALNVTEFVQQYPHLQPRLEDCLESLLAMEEFAGGLNDNESTPGNAPEFSDFQIMSELGKGGMGVVYKAWQKSLSRIVALKVLPPSAVLDKKNLRRFKNEALATARLDHPNIINVFSVGCENGVHFYAMQLVEGQSIAELIKRMRQIDNGVELGAAETQVSNRSNVDASSTSPRLVETEVRSKSGTSLVRSDSTSGITGFESHRRRGYVRAVAQLGIHVADGIHHAHEMGIVHRDIKPANLLLDHKGDVWISDFGLARIQGDVNLTMTGDVLGTLRYMSPEQAEGDSHLIDHRSDIYSLGATLYELLTLEPTIFGKNLKEIHKNLLSENIQNPTRLNSNIPSDLETIILKTLGSTPELRYQNARELAQDLQLFLGDQPILARRPSISQRVGKWIKRNRWIATTAAICAGLLVIGSIVSSALIYNRNEELRLALHRATTAETKLEDAPQLLYQLGKRHFDLQNYNDAARVLESVLVLDDQDSTSRLLLGRAHALSDRSDEAESCFERVLKDRYALPETYWARGRMRINRSSNLKGGLSDLLNAYNGHYKHPDLLANLARASVVENNWGSVEQYSKEALDGNQYAYEMLQYKFLAQWKLKKFDQAVVTHDVLMKKFGDKIDGKLMCISSLAASVDTKLTTAEPRELYFQAIRWFEYRIVENEKLKNLFAYELIEACNAAHACRFDARKGWNEIQNLRLESTQLVNMTGAIKSTQGSMNVSGWGKLWTPIRPGSMGRNGVQLFWRPSKSRPVGDVLRFEWVVSANGTTPHKPGPHQLTAYLTKSNDYGEFRFRLNQEALGDSLDLFDPKPTHVAHAAQFGETNFGLAELIEGINVLEVEVAGKNSKADGYCLGIDFIDLWPVGHKPGG